MCLECEFHIYLLETALCHVQKSVAEKNYRYNILHNNILMFICHNKYKTEEYNLLKWF